MIEFDNVSFTYDGEANALENLSAHVRPGEFVCVLGGNGSGKSTLAKHINALLVPDEGTVRTAGIDTADPARTYDIRQTAGMVFQNPDDQLVASIVEDDVAFGPENLGVAPDELRRRVTRCLAEVGLAGFERHETHALSGGQKQRVAIAGVLAMQPQVLVLDEASAMLDPRGRAGLLRVCRELHARGMTVVAITHFMEEAAEADRVVVMEHGRMVCAGTPDEVLVRADELERLNLEVPFAAHLSAALRRRGVDLRACVTEDELVSAVLGKLGLAEDDVAAGGEGNASGEGAPASDAHADGLPIAGEPANGAAAASPTAIEFQQVSYTYDAARSKRQKQRHGGPAKQAKWGNSPEETWAVRNVDLAVRAGEFLGIAGHTGSGKSTLIQHMNGILHPTSGRVLVDGADIAQKANAAAARGKVGVVFQYPEHQLFAETVREDVAFGPRNLGLSEAEVAAHVRESLARVGLDPDEVGDASPFELSGGQQRRVAFAGVLAMRPQVLVLDEPAAGLDPAARRSFLSLVKSLHDDGLTVVMVSHNMDDLAALCDRVAVMNEGRLIALGTPGQVFVHAAALKTVGLGTTAAQQLACRLRAAGMALPTERLLSEAELADLLAEALR